MGVLEVLGERCWEKQRRTMMTGALAGKRCLAKTLRAEMPATCVNEGLRFSAAGTTSAHVAIPCATRIRSGEHCLRWVAAAEWRGARTLLTGSVTNATREAVR